MYPKHPKIITALKIAAVVLIAMCVVILLSVNKIAASLVLILTAVIILPPLGEPKWLQWARVAFVVVALAFVFWNISTTEYRAACYNTGFMFSDKVLHLFNGFMQNTFGVSLVDPLCGSTPIPHIDRGR